MSPLLSGPGTIRKNVTELMQPVLSPSRKQAIQTIARKNNISIQDAQLRQALAIAKNQSRK